MRAAVIGLGRMGRKHVQVLQSMGLTIVGVCDVSKTALGEVAESFDLHHEILYPEPAMLLKQAAPELTVIATTADSHCKLTCMAAELGSQMILCEKPMACSIADCVRMIEACRSKGVRLAVNHQMRFMEQYSRPKEIVCTEEFGSLSSVTVVAGNFGLAMNGTHYFEMFRFLTGDLPHEVNAWFSPGIVPNPRGNQFEDRAGCVRLLGKSGVRFYLDASSDQGHGFITIYAGTFGILTVDEASGQMHYTRREERFRGEPTTRYLTPFKISDCQIPPADVVAPTRAVVASLIQGSGYPTGEDGANTIRILAAAHQSNNQGGQTRVVSDSVLDIHQVFPWA